MLPYLDGQPMIKHTGTDYRYVKGKGKMLNCKVNSAQGARFVMCRVTENEGKDPQSRVFMTRGPLSCCARSSTTDWSLLFVAVNIRTFG